MIENGMVDYSESGYSYYSTCGGFSNTRYDEDEDEGRDNE